MILRYALKTLVLPPAINLLLVLVGLCLWRRYPRLAKFCVIGGIVSLWLLVTPWVAFQLISPLEYQFSPIAFKRGCPDAGAIVVLGGGMRKQALEYGGDSDVSKESLSRLRYAASLAQRCPIPLAVSGGRVFFDLSASEADLMASVLENEFHVLVSLREVKSRTSAENAALTSTLLQRQGIDAIILVTSAYHMPRAVQSFVKHGIAVMAAPTGFFEERSGVLNWLPSAEALLNSRRALHEYLGILVYKILY